MAEVFLWMAIALLCNSWLAHPTAQIRGGLTDLSHVPKSADGVTARRALIDACRLGPGRDGGTLTLVAVLVLADVRSRSSVCAL